MKNFKSKIIVLGEREKYCVLLQTVYEGKNYFLTVSVNKDDTELGKTPIMFEGKEEKGKCFFKEITDEIIFNKVRKQLIVENKVEIEKVG